MLSKCTLVMLKFYVGGLRSITMWRQLTQDKSDTTNKPQPKLNRSDYQNQSKSSSILRGSVHLMISGTKPSDEDASGRFRHAPLSRI
jgi:hypothetical protein